MFAISNEDGGWAIRYRHEVVKAGWWWMAVQDELLLGSDRSGVVAVIRCMGDDWGLFV